MRTLITVLFAFGSLIWAGCEGSSDAPEAQVCLFDTPVELTDLSIFDFNKNVGDGLWVADDCPTYPGKLIIIRSEADFIKYSVEGREILPRIDFRTHTLLLIQGLTNQGVDSVSKSLLLSDSGFYYLSVEVFHNDAMISQLWKTAVLMPVLPKEATIEFVEVKQAY